MKKRYAIRNADGEFVTSYENLSEANSYLLASYPGASWQEPDGDGQQSIEVKDDEGKTAAILEISAK